MCGITACVSQSGTVTPLLEGLKHLEYRGYDSAGIAVRTGSSVNVVKRVGEVSELADAVDHLTTDGILFDGQVGIGHTRWATHGGVTDSNAHPHVDCTGEIAVVHNGIIDNYDALKADLEARGCRFQSETDTEVIPHLIEVGLDGGQSPETAFRSAVSKLSGSYAVCAIIGDDRTIYATRDGSPLVFGIGKGQYFLASDVPAFIEYTDQVVYLRDGDVLTAGFDGYTISDAAGRPVERRLETIDWDPETATKGGYDHYMAKEIHEQPMALRETIRGRLGSMGTADLDAFPDGTFDDIEQIHLVGMGTSYHAALYAASLLNIRGVPAHAYLAGEYSVVKPPVTDGTLAVAITQSGETADTLKAIRRAKSAGARTLALTNVLGSSITRECDDSLFIRAGPEIGVAATKTFSSQVTALALLAEHLVSDLTGAPSDEASGLIDALSALPGDVQEVLDTTTADEVAAELDGSRAYFFIGRGLGHPVALEGALKFKEISYEHAEGFAASDLKHGPLALVDDTSPVFAVFTGRGDEELLSSVKEVQARDAPVVAITSKTDGSIAEFADYVLPVPETHSDIAGILGNVQLQLVAYHAASLLDRPIDKPRNLAKSVTVE